MFNAPFIYIEHENGNAECSQEMHAQLKQDWQLETSLQETPDIEKSPDLGIVETIWFILLVEPLVTKGVEYLAEQLFDYAKCKLQKYKDRKKEVMIGVKIRTGNDTIAMNVEDDKKVFTSTFARAAKPFIAQRSGFKESLYTLLGNNRAQEVLANILGSLNGDPEQQEIKSACVLAMANLSQFQQQLSSPDIPFEQKLIINSKLNREVLQVIEML